MSRHTPATTLAWQIAAAEAGAAGHARIEPAHLAIGMLSLEKVRGALAESAGLSAADLESLRRERATLAELLAGLGSEPAPLRRALREAVGRGPGAAHGSISRSDATRAVFARAEALAAPGPATTLHLLAELAEEPALAGCLDALGLAGPRLAARARAYAGVALAPRDEGDGQDTPPLAVAPGRAAAERPAAQDPGTPTLDRYGRDLTALARRGELAPVIGRRVELLALLRTLARASKPNPLLVGEPGVGKTALVEALAARVAAGKDPAVLGGLRIVELNLGALLAGTEYRGELERRLSEILAEARARPELVLFADEAHALVGAGRAGGGGPDLASLVKPALARGELRLIGATTPEEYRRHVEADPALARRFERIDVAEPDEAATLEILRGLRPRWERHHGVPIADEALRAAVALSLRFEPERRLPDKAIDLVDRAAAGARVPQLSLREPAAGDAPSPAAAVGPVDARAVALALVTARGLPPELVLERASSGDLARVHSLEAFLRERLVGQDPVVERVARRLRLAHSSLEVRRGPLATFLFLGPSGVGKTELARLLAEHLLGDAAQLTRFDMSECMEEHAVARLLGAPPGYVGHEEEGQLTRALRERPYGVVLLDEVEKAHPRVFDVFLQVFDAGRVTDARGRTADARHAVFVLTSNLGAAAGRAPAGFAPASGQAPEDPEAQARRAAAAFFRPELLNRLDEILVFRPLDAGDTARILRPLLDRLAGAARERHGVALDVSPEAEAFLAREGTSAEQGARGLRRTVERLAEAPLSALIASGKLARHAAWRLVYDEGGLYWVPGEGVPR